MWPTNRKFTKGRFVSGGFIPNFSDSETEIIYVPIKYRNALAILLLGGLALVILVIIYVLISNPEILAAARNFTAAVNK